MNQRNSLMAILALGTVLVMAAVAVAPTANAQALIDADIANVDCTQEQKTKQNTEQDSEQSLYGSIEELLSGNQNSEESAEQDNEHDTDQSADHQNEMKMIDVLKDSGQFSQNEMSAFLKKMSEKAQDSFLSDISAEI